MTGFHEVRFPLSLAFGAVGGPERRTEIVTLGSGREERNTPWAHARRRYDVSGAVRTLDDLMILVEFFEARRGRLYGFRFRDFADWRSSPPSRPIAILDQTIGNGDGETVQFPLVKTYGAGAFAYVRPIRKPVEGSVRVAVAGVELAPEHFTIDHATGMVTLAAAPGPAASVSAGYEFDTPVRFDADRLETSLDAFGAGRLQQAPLIEVIV